MKKLLWQWRELQRLHRLLRPEPSVRRLVKAVGGFWLWRHGVKREHRIELWRSDDGWYCPDFAIPHKKLCVEADGGVHKHTKRRDYVRDFRLSEKGWQILRINDEDVKRHPYRIKRRVRQFFKG